MSELPFCACGCGERVSYKGNTFLWGHNARCQSAETIEKRRQKRIGQKHTLEARKKISESNKGKIISPETRKKISEANRGKIRSLEVREKMSRTQLGRSASQETRKKLSESHKGKTNSPGTKKKISKALMGHSTSQETKDKISRANMGKPSWSKGLTKETHPSIAKQAEKTRGRPTWILGLTKYTHPGLMLRAEKMKGKKASKETRRKMSEARKGYVPSEEHKRKLSETHKALWFNFSFKEKREMLSRTIDLSRMRPNNKEKFLIPILKKYGFVYTGKKLVEIDRRPDFVNKTIKAIIEYDGGGGHDPNVPWVPENKAELDIKRNREYREHDYKLLILLPTDIKKGIKHINTTVEDWLSKLGTCLWRE